MQAEPTMTEKPKPKGRPPVVKQPEVSISMEGDYLVIKVPKKDVSRKLLAELI